MEKRVLERYLVDKKEQIKELEVFPRMIDGMLTKNFVVSILGPRRAGKSYFMYDLIKNKLKLTDEEFVFVNFEDVELFHAGFTDIIECVNMHEEMYGKKPTYIFLDEIQNIANWERAVRSLFERKKYFIFLSGSSSKLLSKEIATSLRGRATNLFLFPLSFKEFISLKMGGIVDKRTISTSDENVVKNNLRTYLQFGGFPDVATGAISRERFFKEYVDLVIFRDVVERHKIKNPFVIKFLINRIITSFSKEFSIHKVYLELKSQGVKVSKKTLYNYCIYLEDAFFSFFVRKFSYSKNEHMLSIPKVFLNDSGMASLYGSSSENFGRLMENVVFIELQRRRNENPLMEVYYYKSPDGKEVDFVVSENGVKELIEVTYVSESKEIDKKQISAILSASEKLKCKKIIVLTWEYEDKKRLDSVAIEFIPLWKWLMGIQIRRG
ncbi:MAG: ATP-binding protein [Candidatus Anstonellales archaeon]